MESPDDPPTQTGISLFLYQVSENAHLKNQDLERRGDNKLVPSPLALDLFYLITPYSSATGQPNTARENEQMLLTKVMRVLHDNSILSGPPLGATLLDSGNTDLRIVPNTVTVEQMNHIWSMFRNVSYKICVSYLASPLLVPSAREITMTRVVTKKLDFANK